VRCPIPVAPKRTDVHHALPLCMRSSSMKASVRFALVLVVLVGMVPAVTNAHFKLLEPASWLIEDDRGDPQKAGPCGGTNADYGKPSYMVSQAVGGSKLHVKVQE